MSTIQGHAVYKGLRESLDALVRLSENVKPELLEAAQIVADQWDQNFNRTSDLLTPLAPKTVGIRRSKIGRGVSPVADENTPLRFEKDSVREAAIDLTGSVPGSAFRVTDKDVTLGIDSSGENSYMRDVLLGRPDRNIPARNEVMTEGLEAAEKKIDDLMNRAMEARIRAAVMAG